MTAVQEIVTTGPAEGHRQHDQATAYPRPRHPGNPVQPDLDPVLPYGRQGHPGNPS